MLFWKAAIKACGVLTGENKKALWQTKRAFLSRLQLPQLSQALCERGRPIVDVALSVAVETVAGRRGRHGDSAAQPAARASSCASAPATTRRPDTAAASAWDRAERRGEDPHRSARDLC